MGFQKSPHWRDQAALPLRFVLSDCVKMGKDNIVAAYAHLTFGRLFFFSHSPQPYGLETHLFLFVMKTQSEAEVCSKFKKKDNYATSKPLHNLIIP